MSKSIKLHDNNYWDSSSVVHNKQKLSEIIDNTNTALRNMSAVFDFGDIPKRITLDTLNKNVFGIYTVLNDDNAPHNNKNNDWYTIINIPANQGVNYSVQIAFSYWDLISSTYGVWIKYGRETTWHKVNIT